MYHRTTGIIKAEFIQQFIMPTDLIERCTYIQNLFQLQSFSSATILLYVNPLLVNLLEFHILSTQLLFHAQCFSLYQFHHKIYEYTSNSISNCNNALNVHKIQ